MRVWAWAQAAKKKLGHVRVCMNVGAGTGMVMVLGGEGLAWMYSQSQASSCKNNQALLQMHDHRAYNKLSCKIHKFEFFYEKAKLYKTTNKR